MTISYRSAALIAISHLYARARANLDIDGCNLYWAAAEKISPDLFSRRVAQRFDEDDDGQDGKTIAGVGGQTIFVRV